MSVRSLKIKDLGVQSYTPIWQKMKAFTEIRDAESDDEIWFVEHPAVFTQGQAGKAEHVIAPGDIPVVKTDRGGQVTYHGPGQVVAYTLIDIRRLGLGVRDLVTAIESTIVQYLATLDITGAPDPKAPGVYVDKAKIAALGLRVRRGCAYHGLSLNVAMDLSPFERINPCGYEGLAVTSLEKLGVRLERQVVVRDLAGLLAHQFGYDAPPIERGN